MIKKRILVTLTHPQGEELCQHIREMGCEAILFPTIEIEPIHPSHSLQENHYDWLVFTSRHAVAFGETLALKNIKLAAVGGKTAEILSAKTKKSVLFDQKNWSSEGLLALPELQEITGQKIAIIRGEGGRGLLEQVMQARGALVTSIILYRRKIPKINTQFPKNIDIIVAASCEGVKNLIALAPHDIFLVPLITVSARIVNYARDLGFKNVLQAKNAGHESIVTEILRT